MVKLLVLVLSCLLCTSCATLQTIKDNPDHPITYLAISASTKALVYSQIRDMSAEQLEILYGSVVALHMVVLTPDGTVDWDAGYVYINQSAPVAYRDLLILSFSVVQIETEALAIKFPDLVSPSKRMDAFVTGVEQAIEIRLGELQVQVQAGLTH